MTAGRALVLVAGMAMHAAPVLGADALAIWTEGAPEGTVELAPGVTVPARAHPCAACHGWDGSGGGEGATRAPDIGRGALAVRGYDAATFATAVDRGLAADGRMLSRAMPRFDLPSSTMTSLWDLTKPLEERRRYGVTPDQIRFAILHDPAEPTSVALVRAYDNALKQVGGPFWGRHLSFIPEPMFRATALASDPTVFAVIGPFAPDPAPRARLAAGQVPMVHGFGTLDAPGARFLRLGLDRTEEIVALLKAARDAGSTEVTPVGGDNTSQAAAERLIRRFGLQFTGEGRGVAYLVLSPEAPVAPGATLLVPEAVLLARPSITAGNHLMTVSRLPFLAGAADPAMVYAETSVRVLAAAIHKAGPDPTRRSVADAAQRFRDAFMEGLR